MRDEDYIKMCQKDMSFNSRQSNDLSINTGKFLMLILSLIALIILVYAGISSSIKSNTIMSSNNTSITIGQTIGPN